MKIFLTAITVALVLFWFANESIQNYGLMDFKDQKWSATKFIGWGIFKGSWVFLLTVALSISIIFTGLVAWLGINFSNREKELKVELADEKQKAIENIEKIHTSQIENMFHTQTNESKYLQNAYAEIEKYRRAVTEQEDENSILIQKIKGKDAVIMRLDRKIKKLLPS